MISKYNVKQIMVTVLGADSLGEWVIVGERRIRGRHRKSLMMAVEAS
jgi:hypothetical protein